MNLSFALSFLGSMWSLRIGKRSAMVYRLTPRGDSHYHQRIAVKRKCGESLESMILRLATAAAKEPPLVTRDQILAKSMGISI